VIDEALFTVGCIIVLILSGILAYNIVSAAWNIRRYFYEFECNATRTAAVESNGVWVLIYPEAFNGSIVEEVRP